MTREEWSLPRCSTLAAAVEVTGRLAAALGRAHTIVASVHEGQLRFEAMLSSSYAQLREQGGHTRIAPVASVLPSGEVEVYRVIQIPVLVSAVDPSASRQPKE